MSADLRRQITSRIRLVCRLCIGDSRGPMLIGHIIAEGLLFRKVMLLQVFRGIFESYNAEMNLVEML